MVLVKTGDKGTQLYLSKKDLAPDKRGLPGDLVAITWNPQARPITHMNPTLLSQWTAPDEEFQVSDQLGWETHVVGWDQMWFSYTLLHVPPWSLVNCYALHGPM